MTTPWTLGDRLLVTNLLCFFFFNLFLSSRCFESDLFTPQTVRRLAPRLFPDSGMPGFSFSFFVPCQIRCISRVPPPNFL